MLDNLVVGFISSLYTQSSARWVKIWFDDLSAFHVKLPFGISREGDAVHYSVKGFLACSLVGQDCKRGLSINQHVLYMLESQIHRPVFSRQKVPKFNFFIHYGWGEVFAIWRDQILLASLLH